MYSYSCASRETEKLACFIDIHWIKITARINGLLLVFWILLVGYCCHFVKKCLLVYQKKKKKETKRKERKKERKGERKKERKKEAAHIIKKYISRAKLVKLKVPVIIQDPDSSHIEAIV